MSEKRIIAVLGATGAQGGGLVRAIQGDKEGGFKARALTRNPDSDKAKALADLGAEVAFVDVDNAESLKKAFEGAYGAYCVTFYWEHMSPEREFQNAIFMAKAARACGLEHVIWSTLEDTRKWMSLDDDRMPTLMEKYKVPHFDSKGSADQVFVEQGVPTTFLVTCFYWDNMIHFGTGPQKDADGNYALTMPMGDKKLPGIAAEDIGKCAYGIFKRGTEMIGKRIGIAGEHLTGAEMAAKMTKALGKEIAYNDIPPNVYRSFDFPGADDMGNMFQFKRDFNEDYVGARDIEFARKLNPELMNFDAWLKKYASQIPMG